MSQLADHSAPVRYVLVVEDESEVCDLLGDILSVDGFEPVCASSDAEALAALRRHRFACLIVDVNLGRGVTGFDVARHARQLDARLPVVFVSGQIAPSALERFGVAGAQFLPKPFTATQLTERVRRLVGDNDD